MAQYWLLDWLDKEGIADPDIASGVLRTREGVARFVDAAEVASQQPPEPPRAPNSMVAAGGLALTGQHACVSAGCLTRTIDQLVFNSWHYFERVVVTGLDPRRVPDFVEGPARLRDADIVQSHVTAALHVRDIGAEDLFYFQRPMALCVRHLDEHAVEAGLASATGTADELADQLSRGYTLDLRETPRGLLYGFRHPALTYIPTGLAKRGLKKKQLARDIAKRQARSLTATFIRSASLARASHSSLAQMTSVNSPIFRTTSDIHATPPEVALELQLPLISGLTAQELMELRRQEADEFEIFRGAMKKVIEERLKALPNDDAKDVAQSVTHDVLSPAIASLARKVDLSSRLLSKRSQATLLAGGLVTTVGFAALAPLTVPGLVIAAGGVLSGVTDYLKEQRENELSDLHFLWRVSDFAAGRH